MDEEIKKELIRFREWMVEFDRYLSFAEDITRFHTLPAETLVDMYLKKISPFGWKNYMDENKK